MNLLHNTLKLELAKLVQPAVAALGAEMDLEELYQLFGPAPNVDLGHFAFPCFSFAKALRKGPPVIAKEILAGMPESPLLDSVVATGPYLNFKLSKDALGRYVAEAINSGEFFQRKLTSDTPRTMIEYSQPNTHKVLHVGHMRNLALGEALIHMHRYCGYDIVSATFPGDMGTHVAKTLWYMKYKNTEPIPVELSDEEKGAWLGEMYSKASILLEDELGTEREEQNRSQLTAILKQLEAMEGEYYDLWKETRAWSFALMEQVYAWAGVTFDAWYWESDVDAVSLEYARKMYAEGKFIESEGAVGMDLEEDGLGFAMAIKGDGTGLYLTKDVELARRKFEEFGIEKSVYVVDKRQEHHFNQVFKVLEKLGFEQAKDCYHLKYNYVELPSGPMSSRAGNIVPIMDLIEGMQEAIRRDYLDSQVEEGTMTEAEAVEIAATVAKGAIKYGMVKIDTQKKIVFSMEEWVKLSGNSGPYQQYVCARISSLLAKQGYDAAGPRDWNLLSEDSEMGLLVKLAEFNDAVLAATQKFQPNMLSNYLYDLAKGLNGFYNDVSIRDTEDPVLKNTRMALLDAVRRTIAQGLELLGISVPAKM